MAPTASYTWSTWTTSGVGFEALIDQVLTSSIAYARNSADSAGAFTSTTKALSSQLEGALSTTITDSWATIFGLSANDTVTQAQITASQKRLVSATFLTTHKLGFDMVSTSTASVMASQLVADTGLSTATDAGYVAGPTGSAVNVNSGSQAANTPVRLQVRYTLTSLSSSGTPNMELRFDNVAMTITYTQGNYTDEHGGIFRPQRNYWS